MKIKVISLILFFISACATQQVERHSLDGWTVIYNEDTFKLCERAGCTLPKSKEIYCYRGDDMVCGHELRHITDGNFHGGKNDR